MSPMLLVILKARKLSNKRKYLTKSNGHDKEKLMVNKVGEMKALKK